MKKCDARILWNVDNDHKICGFRVAEFVQGKYEQWPTNLHSVYSKDIGNASSDWDQWTLVDVLLKFFVQQEFASVAIRDRAIDELAEIDEFFDEFVKFWPVRFGSLVRSRKKE
jgi:hypothetical protein